MEVAWCTRGGRGTRIIPNGTLQGVHFVRTPDYIQVTGVGDFTQINVQAGDGGGGAFSILNIRYHHLNCTTQNWTLTALVRSLQIDPRGFFFRLTKEDS